MANLKKHTTPPVRDALAQLETRADECWRSLQLLTYPANTALWALMVGGIGVVERAHSKGGANAPNFHAMLLNLSRLLPIAMKWVAGHAQPSNMPLNTNWTPDLSAAVQETMAVARHYFTSKYAFRPSTRIS